MIAMSPRGSGLPAYSPQRDLLYRMRAWVQGGGMAELRKREADFTPEAINELNIVAMAVVDLVVDCQQRAVAPEDISKRMDAIFQKYPQAYANVLHCVFISIFSQYRTFIGEAMPGASNPPSNDAPAQALAASEKRVEDYIKGQS